MSGRVFIVHTIDTEGPLFEPLEAKFERLEELYGLSGVEPTIDNLQRLKNGEIDLGNKTEKISLALQSHAGSTLGSWEEINAMLRRVTERAYREQLPDHDGNGWVYTWYCMDHVGFNVNPRKRDIGHHHVHDRYTSLVEDQPWSRDAVEFHFHPVSTYREAHRCATHYLRYDDLFEILSRRILERGFFPASYRAGFQAERPDSHWFLEQFIPFDFSNMATKDTHDLDASTDFRNGRSGNWRRAPSDWRVYRPDHDDYQKEGRCRRLIARSLNLRSRIAAMTQDEMNAAFARAASGLDTVVGMCSHDWRDLEPEVDAAVDMLRASTCRYPNVPFHYSPARPAFQTQLTTEERQQEALDLSLEFVPERPGQDVPFIRIEAKRGKVFGPQPFLAIKTKSRRFLHDNLDFGDMPNVWYYAFHGDTLPLEDVEEIGVGASDILGNTITKTFRPGY
ncbi:hypothetical protein E2K80_11670 [Rhodophyticola sp. CCM32]|uniref:hypothetical protein n=1 Tax=Rhodophyticola sp. CCM32 TaxID=2916397 RepID=UPI00107F2EA4|nr:hypothetical protein [Rhodophyticola sp. CCM32]QBY01304.1 hypothetical protein E2K80_11670 [Rhodophyticola sp. CCM32]